MDLVHGNLKKLYGKLLSASFGSAMIASIYGIVDMAMVGQYEGASGTAALAVVAPVYNILYSLGLLAGIGGSIHFATARASGKKANGYYTASLMAGMAAGMICWTGLLFFSKDLLLIFGADQQLLDLAIRYLQPVTVVAPVFLFNQLLAAFLRNDGDATLAAGAVLAGGIFNVFGDYLCIFKLNMGIYGAGLATSIGAVITFMVLCIHFFKTGNTLHIEHPLESIRLWPVIGSAGFSAFFSDIAMGILTILFNNQIMRYLGSEALAVYGIIINISTLVQCNGYAAGQAAQPLLSSAYGAGKYIRLKKVLSYSLVTVACFGAFWTLLNEGFPLPLLEIFMKPTDTIQQIAPGIIRMYSLSYLLLPFTIYSTYYFQSILEPKPAMVIAVGRGLIVSGILVMVLPLISPNALWLAMPVTELVIAGYAGVEISKSVRRLSAREDQ